MALLSEATIRRRQRIGQALQYASVAIGVALTAAIVFWPIPGGRPVPGVVLALNAFMFVIFAGLLSAILVGFVSLLPIYGSDENAWLPPSDCGDVADLFSRNPELANYRDRVLATGRRFTVGEVAAMRAWLENRARAEQRAQADARVNADCRRLYGGADRRG